MVSDTQEAKMMMYKGMNYDGSDIASAVGVSESTVYTYLNEWEEKAKASDNPITEVYGPVIVSGVFGDSFAKDGAMMLFGNL